MKKLAHYILNVEGVPGDMRLYRLDPPLESRGEHEYVVVSAVPDAPQLGGYGPETYIFIADEVGNVTEWGELEGSYRGGLDHAVALAGLGYEVFGADTVRPPLPVTSHDVDPVAVVRAELERIRATRDDYYRLLTAFLEAYASHSGTKLEEAFEAAHEYFHGKD